MHRGEAQKDSLSLGVLSQRSPPLPTPYFSFFAYNLQLAESRACCRFLRNLKDAHAGLRTCISRPDAFRNPKWLPLLAHACASLWSQATSPQSETRVSDLAT